MRGRTPPSPQPIPGLQAAPTTREALYAPRPRTPFKIQTPQLSPEQTAQVDRLLAAQRLGTPIAPSTPAQLAGDSGYVAGPRPESIQPVTGAQVAVSQALPALGTPAQIGTGARTVRDAAKLTAEFSGIPGAGRFLRDAVTGTLPNAWDAVDAASLVPFVAPLRFSRLGRAGAIGDRAADLSRVPSAAARERALIAEASAPGTDRFFGDVLPPGLVPGVPQGLQTRQTLPGHMLPEGRRVGPPGGMEAQPISRPVPEIERRAIARSFGVNERGAVGGEKPKFQVRQNPMGRFGASFRVVDEKGKSAVNMRFPSREAAQKWIAENAAREQGNIVPPMLLGLTGAGAGGLAGAATAPEGSSEMDRLQRALIGAGLGGLGGFALGAGRLPRLGELRPRPAVGLRGQRGGIGGGEEVFKAKDEAVARMRALDAQGVKAQMQRRPDGSFVVISKGAKALASDLPGGAVVAPAPRKVVPAKPPLGTRGQAEESGFQSRLLTAVREDPKLATFTGNAAQWEERLRQVPGAPKAELDFIFRKNPDPEVVRTQAAADAGASLDVIDEYLAMLDKKYPAIGPDDPYTGPQIPALRDKAYRIRKQYLLAGANHDGWTSAADEIDYLLRNTAESAQKLGEEDQAINDALMNAYTHSTRARSAGQTLATARPVPTLDGLFGPGARLTRDDVMQFLERQAPARRAKRESIVAEGREAPDESEIDDRIRQEAESIWESDQEIFWSDNDNGYQAKKNAAKASRMVQGFPEPDIEDLKDSAYPPLSEGDEDYADRLAEIEEQLSSQQEQYNELVGLADELENLIDRADDDFFRSRRGRMSGVTQAERIIERMKSLSEDLYGETPDALASVLDDIESNVQDWSSDWQYTFEEPDWAYLEQRAREYLEESEPELFEGGMEGVEYWDYQRQIKEGVPYYEGHLHMPGETYPGHGYFGRDTMAHSRGEIHEAFTAPTPPNPAQQDLLPDLPRLPASKEPAGKTFVMIESQASPAQSGFESTEEALLGGYPLQDVEHRTRVSVGLALREAADQDVEFFAWPSSGDRTVRANLHEDPAVLTYDVHVPKAVKWIFKQLDIPFEPVSRQTMEASMPPSGGYGPDTPPSYGGMIRLTPEAKEKIKRLGIPIFGLGGALFGATQAQEKKKPGP